MTGKHRPLTPDLGHGDNADEGLVLRIDCLQLHANLEGCQGHLWEGVVAAAATANEGTGGRRAGAAVLVVAGPGETASGVAPGVSQVVVERGLVYMEEGGYVCSIVKKKNPPKHSASFQTHFSPLTLAMISWSLLAASTSSASLVASALALVRSVLACSTLILLATSSALLASASLATLSARSALSFSSRSLSRSFLFASRLCFCTSNSLSRLSFSLIKKEKNKHRIITKV